MILNAAHSGARYRKNPSIRPPCVHWCCVPANSCWFNENTLHGSGPNRTSRPRVGLTPRISVPFVRVTGNPRGAGRDRARHAPDEPREVAMLRGHDYTGRQRVVALPCGAG